MAASSQRSPGRSQIERSPGRSRSLASDQADTHGQDTHGANAHRTPAENLKLRFGKYFVHGSGAEYHACKADLIRLIVTGRIYREPDLRALFDSFLLSNGNGCYRKEVVVAVVADLEDEFDVMKSNAGARAARNAALEGGADRPPVAPKATIPC